MDDLGEACIFALEHWNPEAEDAPRDAISAPLSFLNVGNGLDLSIEELAQAVADVLGFHGAISWDRRKPDGTPKKQLDVSRLAALGWPARIPLAEGLLRAVEDYRGQLHDGGARL